MADDELFQVKNHFYLGAYQLAVNEATQSAYSEECKTELDCLVYRSYIGMGNYGVRATHRDPLARSTGPGPAPHTTPRLFLCTALGRRDAAHLSRPNVCAARPVQRPSSGSFRGGGREAKHNLSIVTQAQLSIISTARSKLAETAVMLATHPWLGATEISWVS